MKRLIDVARSVTESNVDGRAVVKSQTLHDPAVGGTSPTGIYYEGPTLPPTLAVFIGENDVNLSIWRSKGALKIFVTPQGNI